MYKPFYEQRPAIDLAEVINAKVIAFIEKMKSIALSATKMNGEYLCHPKGRGENYYKFMIDGDRFCRFLDYCYDNMYPEIAEYLWQKRPVCPSTVLPVFGYMLRNGKFQAAQVKDVDYRAIFKEMFSVESHRVDNRHCSDVGRYCVAQLGSFKKLIAESPSLATTILEKITEFNAIDIQKD